MLSCGKGKSITAEIKHTNLLSSAQCSHLYKSLQPDCPSRLNAASETLPGTKDLLSQEFSMPFERVAQMNCWNGH